MSSATKTTGSLLIRGGTLVTMDPARCVLHADLLIQDGRIAAIGTGLDVRADDVFDASGMAVLPGLVQTHVHLCQTLFRGMADGLELLEWLRQRIWPFEAAHDPESVAASARLGCAELILGGTTTIVDMGTVHHTGEIFRAIEASGLRALAGKCMMDTGDEAPAGLRETTDASLRESIDLLDEWHGAAGGRIRYAFAPRFALSCSETLLAEVAREAESRGVHVHTHASESVGECELVAARRGAPPVEYFNRVGLTGPRTILAHCVHLSDHEMGLLADTGTAVAHCPSSNLKLASGIAPIAELRRRGVAVGIGADGAPCNNELNGFLELRLAAQLQSVGAGPGALTAMDALEMVTIGGAHAIGMADEIGSLEIGKRADVIAVDLDTLHSSPDGADPENVVSRLVYSARASDVRLTVVDGRVLLRDKKLLTLDEDGVRQEASRALAVLERRVG
ncbi:MAG TPA: 5'-deoxyadenosine deaminase [Longimicrobiales bacterium]|nr:5'-deoxyadenosine deaminase [Longimicrobiales bacterium]